MEGSRVKILVVESDPEVRDAYVTRLEAALTAPDIYLAATVSTALRLIARFSPLTGAIVSGHVESGGMVDTSRVITRFSRTATKVVWVSTIATHPHMIRLAAQAKARVVVMLGGDLDEIVTTVIKDSVEASESS